MWHAGRRGSALARANCGRASGADSTGGTRVGRRRPRSCAWGRRHAAWAAPPIGTAFGGRSGQCALASMLPGAPGVMEAALRRPRRPPHPRTFGESTSARIASCGLRSHLPTFSTARRTLPLDFLNLYAKRHGLQVACAPSTLDRLALDLKHSRPPCCLRGRGCGSGPGVRARPCCSTRYTHSFGCEAERIGACLLWPGY